MKRRIAIGAVGATLAALAGLSALNYRTTRELIETDGWVGHTHRVIERLEGLANALTEAESDCRGYLLTGDQAQLGPYHAAAARARGAVAEVRALTVDNPAQQARINALEEIVRRKLDSTGALIDQRGAEGSDLRQLAEGREAMGAFNHQLGEMETAERSLLEQREATTVAHGRSALRAIEIVGVAGFVVASVSCLVLMRESRRRRRAEHELGRFLATSLELIGIAGMEGRFISVNPAFTRVLGWSASELTSRPYLDFIHPDDVEPSRLASSRLRDGSGFQLVNFENRYRCKDGSWRWLLWSAIFDPAIQGTFVVAHDITARKRMEQALRDKEAEVSAALKDAREKGAALERSNRELKEFAHVASHDLQEPLRMVSSYCALLSETCSGKLGAEADEFIGHAVDGAKRMQVLIQDLLTYARVENRASEPKPMALSDAVEEALANLQGAIAESGASVELGESAELTADPRQLAQLLQNLIGNAIKYRSEAPPRIRVAARRVDDAVEISVADNGLGIAPRHHQRIFGMFKRLHSRERYPGNGIGLAICRKIVELHGGAIRVESELGKGSTFLVRLPTAAAPVAASEHRA